jgi:leucyl/phenylalanyl-tRNA--protein transferase
VGGIYGLAVGGLFAGESMFHLRTDTSKIAFAALAEKLRAAGFALFDVQVQNSHLESLGCVEVPRAEYLARLRAALPLTPRLI